MRPARPSSRPAPAVLIRFTGHGVSIYPITSSDGEACELARRFQRLLATLIEAPGEVRRLCGCDGGAG